MTRPDATRKTRNSLAAVAATLACISLGSVLTMNWWVLPVDYWLMAASISTGLGTIGNTIGAIVAHCIYIDEMRTN